MAMSSGDKCSIHPEQRALLVISILFAPGLAGGHLPFFDTEPGELHGPLCFLFLLIQDVPTLLSVE